MGETVYDHAARLERENRRLSDSLAAARRECDLLRKALIALDELREHRGDCARENEYGATCNCGFDDVQEKVTAALESSHATAQGMIAMAKAAGIPVAVNESLAAPAAGEEGTR